MRILFINESDLDRYSRGRVIVKGLRRRNNTVEIVTSNERSKFWLFAKALLTRQFTHVYMRAGFLVLIMAKVLQPLYRRPIIYDQFVSVYDTAVNDREIAKDGSLNAKWLWFQDWLTCRLADIVMFDTVEHKDYFTATFGFKGKNMVVPVGADSDLIDPYHVEQAKKPFRVVFYGSFIPLQGIETILKTAYMMKDEPIKFYLYGKGQSRYEESVRLAKVMRLKNVEFNGVFLLFTELIDLVKDADLILGIFGDTEKAKRVVPNKVYEALAMRKPLITGDTQAVRSIGLKDDVHCLLVPLGNSEALRDAIMRCYKDKELRIRLADKGYVWFMNNASIQRVAQKFVKRLE